MRVLDQSLVSNHPRISMIQMILNYKWCLKLRFVIVMIPFSISTPTPSLCPLFVKLQPQTKPESLLFFNAVTRRTISAGADGGPRFRVCAR